MYNERTKHIDVTSFGRMYHKAPLQLERLLLQIIQQI
jgi:hypothetical protein